jgi:hypothetical protein
MIQLLPPDGLFAMPLPLPTASPVPGVATEPPADDVFAALLAGQVAVPPVVIPGWETAREDAPDAPVAQGSMPTPTPHSVQADFRMPRPAPSWTDHRLSRTALPPTDLAPLVQDASLESGMADSQRLELPKAGMRTMELWVDALDLQAASRAHLATELQLATMPVGRHARPEAVILEALANQPIPRDYGLQTSRRPVPVASIADAVTALAGPPVVAVRQAHAVRTPDAGVDAPRVPAAASRGSRPVRTHVDAEPSARQTPTPPPARESGQPRPLAIARSLELRETSEPAPQAPESDAPAVIRTTAPAVDPAPPQPATSPVVRQELFSAPGGVDEAPAVRFVLEDWNADVPVRSIRISLEPRELGTIRINLRHQGGQVHARVVVENAQALHLVQSQAQALQAALSEQGLVFGTFSVTAAANATWLGLPAASALRPDRGDQEKHHDEEPEQSTRTEVKTT